MTNGDQDRPPRRVVADLLGQTGERQLAITGWIGEQPEDGGDVAHLLVHPHGQGVADKMRALAAIFGLAAGGPPPQVAPDTTWVGLDQPPGWARIHHGDAAWIGRPVTADWLAVARARHMVVLSLALDGGRVSDDRRLDRYVASQMQRDRLFLGLVRAAG